MNLCGMSPMPVHTARGGSHALTHALVKCLVTHGGDIWMYPGGMILGGPGFLAAEVVGEFLGTAAAVS
jgi:hypothetical protein